MKSGALSDVGRGRGDAMGSEDSDSVRRAKAIVAREPIPPAAALQLARQLKMEGKFRRARLILETVNLGGVTDSALRLRIAKERVLCTSKDHELPVLLALHQALKILGEADDLDITTDQETLGLAGLIQGALAGHGTEAPPRAVAVLLPARLRPRSNRERGLHLDQRRLRPRPARRDRAGRRGPRCRRPPARSPGHPADARRPAAKAGR